MKKKLIAIFCVLVSLLLIGFNTKSNTVTNTKIPGEDTSEVLDLVKDSEPNKEAVKEEKNQDTKDSEVKKEDKSDKSTEQKGKIIFDYVIACENHDQVDFLLEHVKSKGLPLKEQTIQKNRDEKIC